LLRLEVSKCQDLANQLSDTEKMLQKVNTNIGELRFQLDWTQNQGSLLEEELCQMRNEKINQGQLIFQLEQSLKEKERSLKLEHADNARLKEAKDELEKYIIT
jgi:chromosome segregation ATPase